eukprot:TRINITY_DN62731_c0_g1_i1.p1 TRINITY_DN62731_c0_g1~~TRINITY_DN62731_c0_g1_i1.p1  ORF type:complete len:249 (+),score=64.08 TRINITY_DN62731_c0_g1_i1:55-801(+)
MVADGDGGAGAAERKKRKRAKRPGKPRTSKMKREKRRLAREADKEDEEESQDERQGAGATASKKRKRAEAETVEDKDSYEHRVFVSGLPENTTEKKLRKYFGGCGAIRKVQLVKNTRLIFKGTAFVSFMEEAGVTAALHLDACELDGKTLSVRTAVAPIERPSLRVYVGGLPFEADEKTLRKDWKECGEISSLRMVRDAKTSKFKGDMFVTYADAAGVKAALAFDGTEYGGRTIQVRVADSRRSGKRA